MLRLPSPSTFGADDVKASTAFLTFALLGLLSGVSVNIVGRLYLTDLILPALCLLFWVVGRNFWRDRFERNILLLGLFWLLGQLFADFFRGSSLNDMLRGTASIVTLLLQFSALYQIARSQQARFGDHALVWLLYGTALGGMLMPLVSPTPYSETDPWKFGYGIPAAITLVTLLHRMAVSSSPTSRHLATLFAFAFGGVSVWLGYRSLGGAVMLAALVCEVRFTPLGRFLSRWKGGIRAIIFAVAGGAAAYVGLVSAYGRLAESGWLGEEQKAKYEAQSSGEFGLLVGGRLDLIPAIMAIKDSPLVGYGSWAKDSRYRSYLLLADRFGYRYEEGVLESKFERSEEIPAHSHILQAWLWAGLPGLLFWLYVAYLVVRAAFGAFASGSALTFPIVFLMILSLWDIAFSPFGSFVRYQWAMRLTLFLCVLTAANRGSSSRLARG